MVTKLETCHKLRKANLTYWQVRIWRNSQNAQRRVTITSKINSIISAITIYQLDRPTDNRDRQTDKTPGEPTTQLQSTNVRLII